MEAVTQTSQHRNTQSGPRETNMPGGVQTECPDSEVQAPPREPLSLATGQACEPKQPLSLREPLRPRNGRITLPVKLWDYERLFVAIQNF